MEDRAALVDRLVRRHKEMRSQRQSSEGVGTAIINSDEIDSFDTSLNFASDLIRTHESNYFRPSSSVQRPSSAPQLGRESVTYSKRKYLRTREETILDYNRHNHQSLTRPAKNVWQDHRSEAPRKRDIRAQQQKERLVSLAEERLRSECTFKPTLPSRSAVLARKRVGYGSAAGAARVLLDQSEIASVSALQRLHTESLRKLQDREYLSQQLQEARDQNLTFTPKINDLGGVKHSPEYKPIYDRVADVQRKRSERLLQLKAALDRSATAELTFSPSTFSTHKSMSMSRDSASLADVGSRLMNEGRLLDYKKQIKAAEMEKIHAAMYSQPKLSPGTELLAQTSPLVEASFDQRLQMLDFKYRLNEENKKRAIEQEQRSWFHPSIYENSTRIVAKSMPHMLVESDEQRASRMSSDALAQRLSAVKQLEEAAYSDYTFTPKIDPVSRQLARSSTVDELSSDFRGAHHRCIVLRKAEEEMKSKCTFKPAINTKYEGPRLVNIPIVASDYVVSSDCGLDGFENSRVGSASMISSNPYVRSNMYLHNPDFVLQQIHAQKKLSEEKREQSVKEREVEELQECSFKPKVKPPPKASGEPVVIKGLDRFMQLREWSCRLDKERERRQEEAFRVKNVDLFRRREDNSTIVQVRATQNNHLVASVLLHVYAALSFSRVSTFAVKRCWTTYC